MNPQTPELPQLTRKQELALVAVLAGATDAEAAKAARVSRETINRWRHGDANFIAELNRRRAELWTGAVDALRGLVPRAVAALCAVLDDGTPQLRLQAAALVLRTAGLGERGLAPAVLRTSPTEVRAEWQAEGESRARNAAFDAMVRGSFPGAS